MFAYLEGTVESVDDRSAAIDVNGVGYRVFATAPPSISCFTRSGDGSARTGGPSTGSSTPAISRSSDA